jgi:drug/metabolite transporter (DMT)-like permease
MTNQNRAYIFALLAVLCWSTVASAFKLTLRQVDYLTMLLFSSCVSTIFLFVTLLAQGKAGLLIDALSVRRHSMGGTSVSAGERSADERSVGRRSASVGEQSVSAVTRPPEMRRPNEGKLRGREILRSGVIRSAANGFLNPFLYYVILFKAYSLLPAQEAQPLNFTWPIVLVFLSAPMLGQRVRPLSILALGVSFLGVLIVSTHGDLFSLRFTNLPGAILAMGSAVIWALFWLTNVKDERDEVLKLFLNFFFGFLYILVTTLVLDLIRTTGACAREGACVAWQASAALGTGVWAREVIGFTLSGVATHGVTGVGALSLRGLTMLARTGVCPVPDGPPLVGTAGLLGCVYIGIFEMGAAFVLWLKALQLSEATAKVSNLIFLSPFISLIFIRFVVGERILPSSIIGLGFIAGGILIQRTVKGGKSQEPYERSG